MTLASTMTERPDSQRLVEASTESSAPTPATMRAIVQERYGGPGELSLQTVSVPSPADDEVLVRVGGASISQGDLHVLSGTPYLVRLGWGLRKPKYSVPGMALAGRVVAIGSCVTDLVVGDDVFGEIPGGAFAEYVAVRASSLAPKPSRLTYEAAAAVPWGATAALQGLRDVGRLRSNQRVLINGASGGVGSFAVQIAKASGAEVTAVSRETHRAWLTDAGADFVIDYATEDFCQAEKPFDLIFDLVGNRSLSDYRRVLTESGVYVAAGETSPGHWIGPIVRALKIIGVSRFVRPSLRVFLARPSRDDLVALTSLIDDGRVNPVIDRTYSLVDVPEALANLSRGHARGKTVIRMD